MCSGTHSLLKWPAHTTHICSLARCTRLPPFPMSSLPVAIKATSRQPDKMLQSNLRACTRTPNLKGHLPQGRNTTKSARSRISICVVCGAICSRCRVGRAKTPPQTSLKHLGIGFELVGVALHGSQDSTHVEGHDQ